MNTIKVLDNGLVNKIAAGEVVERPLSVVKELVENSIDAGATAITVEIEDGGISKIRITDNGCGIPKGQLKTAFLRHATSKIASVDDLINVMTLGFRGEALSSIAAVSQLEITTKTANEVIGSKITIEGGRVVSEGEIGCNTGTTMIIRNLFFNIPVRRKFLKKPATEGAYISDIIEKIALGHPEIALKYINNSGTIFQTNGSGNLKTTIFQVYGADISKKLIAVEYEANGFSLSGYVCRPECYKSNRSYENFYINGRYVKCEVVQNAVEDALKTRLMTGKFPVFVLNARIQPELVDVNVHPTKLEVRFDSGTDIYQWIFDAVYQTFRTQNLIPDVKLSANDPLKNVYERMYQDESENSRDGNKEIEVNYASAMKKRGANTPIDELYTGGQSARVTSFNEALIDPKDVNNYEINEMTGGKKQKFAEAPVKGFGGMNKSLDTKQYSTLDTDSIFATGQVDSKLNETIRDKKSVDNSDTGMAYRLAPSLGNELSEIVQDKKDAGNSNAGMVYRLAPSQESEHNVTIRDKKDLAQSNADMTLYRLAHKDTKDMSAENPLTKNRFFYNYKIIGQLFNTYWIIEQGNDMYMIDQHAAHERIIYEEMLERYKAKEIYSQTLLQADVIKLCDRDANILTENIKLFADLGFDIRQLNHNDFEIHSVPYIFTNPARSDFISEVINFLGESKNIETCYDLRIDSIAKLACKAAVKANDKLAYIEAESIVKRIMDLENPFNCPHGRPTIIKISRNEIEKMFKRVT